MGQAFGDEGRAPVKLPIVERPVALQGAQAPGALGDRGDGNPLRVIPDIGDPGDLSRRALGKRQPAVDRNRLAELAQQILEMPLPARDSP